MEEKKQGNKKGDKIRNFGRSSKSKFMSNNIQNKLIDTISKKFDQRGFDKGQRRMGFDVSKHE